MKKLLSLLLVAFILAGCTSPTTKDEGEKTNEEEVEKDKKEDKPETNPTTYKHGMYKIGDDMPAGEYVIEVNGKTSTYMEVTSDSSGTFSSIIVNDNFYNRTYITVSEGQYLSFGAGVATPIEETPAYTPNNGLYPSGMYLVGKDIAPGEYKISVEEDSFLGSGYYAIVSNSLGTFQSIITNNNIENDTYQTIEEGQYITLSGTYIQN